MSLLNNKSLITRIMEIEKEADKKTEWRTNPVILQRFKEWDFHDDLKNYSDPITAISTAIKQYVEREDLWL